MRVELTKTAIFGDLSGYFFGIFRERTAVTTIITIIRTFKSVM